MMAAEKEKSAVPSLDGATITVADPETGSTAEGDVEKQPQSAVEEEEEDQDPNIVTYDGPDDPTNPKNWPDSKKWFNIAVLSTLTIIT